eukprot:GHVN01069936.1.p1 GENE.GHVN01069936.1~~GHVN01069936.1.p1  ORF type:complete len:1095 (-),score=216.46 GHVN01069936.1:916-4200(-)
MIDECIPTEDVRGFDMASVPQPDATKGETAQQRQLGENQNGTVPAGASPPLPLPPLLTPPISLRTPESLTCPATIPDLWVSVALSDASVKGFYGKTGMVSLYITVEMPTASGPSTSTPISREGDIEQSQRQDYKHQAGGVEGANDALQHMAVNGHHLVAKKFNRPMPLDHPHHPSNSKSPSSKKKKKTKTIVDVFGHSSSIPRNLEGRKVDLNGADDDDDGDDDSQDFVEDDEGGEGEKHKKKHRRGKGKGKRKGKGNGKKKKEKVDTATISSGPSFMQQEANTLNQVCLALESSPMPFDEMSKPNVGAQFKTVRLAVDKFKTAFDIPTAATNASRTEGSDEPVASEAPQQTQPTSEDVPINTTKPPNGRNAILQSSAKLPQLSVENMLVAEIRVPRNLENVSLVHIKSGESDVNHLAGENDPSQARSRFLGSFDQVRGVEDQKPARHHKQSPASLYIRLWDVAYDDADVLLSFEEHPTNLLQGFLRLDPYPPPTILRLSKQQRNDDLDGILANDGPDLGLDTSEGDKGNDEKASKNKNNEAKAKEHKTNEVKSNTTANSESAAIQANAQPSSSLRHGSARVMTRRGRHSPGEVMGDPDDELFWTIEVAYPPSKTNPSAPSKAKKDHVIRLAVFPKSLRPINEGQMEVFLQPSNDFIFQNPTNPGWNQGEVPDGTPLSLSIVFVLLLVLIFLATVAFGLLICLNEYGLDATVFGRLFRRSNRVEEDGIEAADPLTDPPRSSHTDRHSPIDIDRHAAPDNPSLLSGLLPSFLKGGNSDKRRSPMAFSVGEINTSSSSGSYTRAPLTSSVEGVSDLPTVEMTDRRHQDRSGDGHNRINRSSTVDDPEGGSSTSVTIRNKLYNPLRSKIDSYVKDKPWNPFQRVASSDSILIKATSEDLEQSATNRQKNKKKKDKGGSTSSVQPKKPAENSGLQTSTLSSIEELDELETNATPSPYVAIRSSKKDPSHSTSTMASPADAWSTSLMAVAAGSDEEEISHTRSPPAPTPNGLHKAELLFKDYGDASISLSGDDETKEKSFFSRGVYDNIPHPNHDPNTGWQDQLNVNSQGRQLEAGHSLRYPAADPGPSGSSMLNEYPK